MKLIFNIEDRLVLKRPSVQTALDIFKGTWISKIPGPYESGTTPLFDDPRIPDCIPHVGSIKGKTVLDLGPLEGGQAYVLQNMGAKSVISIEANAILYLKCLVAKEALHLDKVSFLCGDVVEYLKGPTAQFDLCVASGILYHMQDPVELLHLLANKTNKLIIWTHYFDAVNIGRNKLPSFKGISIKHHDGIDYNYYRQEYGDGFTTNVYCGGTAQYSNWMTKDAITLALMQFGYILNIVQDGDSINGPFMLLTAVK